MRRASAELGSSTNHLTTTLLSITSFAISAPDLHEPNRRCPASARIFRSFALAMHRPIHPLLVAVGVLPRKQKALHQLSPAIVPRWPTRAYRPPFPIECTNHRRP